MQQEVGDGKGDCHEQRDTLLFANLHRNPLPTGEGTLSPLTLCRLDGLSGAEPTYNGRSESTWNWA